MGSRRISFNFDPIKTESYQSVRLICVFYANMEYRMSSLRQKCKL